MWSCVGRVRRRISQVISIVVTVHTVSPVPRRVLNEIKFKQVVKKYEIGDSIRQFF